MCSRVEDGKDERNSPSLMRRNLTKQERITRGSDIKRVFSSSRRYRCDGMRLCIRKNESDVNRLAVSFVRRYGTAVQRNKARRWIREIYRNTKSSILPGNDIAVVLYPGSYSFSMRKQQLYTLLRRAELVKGPLWSEHG